MLFNSLHYLIYLPIVVSLYFALPHKWRWLLLLIASYYFYMCWKAEYAVLMVISTLLAYTSGLGISRSENPRVRKAWLWGCISILLTILFTFKYFNFVNNSLHAILAQFRIPLDIPFLNVLLPVGISFYTFQKISYVVDVYHGKAQAEKNLGIFAVYSCFFPQLVAGPIERAPHLLGQFYEKHEFSYERVTSGLRLILWGFFKKVAVADRLAVLVQTVYNDPRSYQGPPLILATLSFGFQIYCDFSGYSDIAIGSARLMGFDLMQNFRQPYFSKSIPEFWRRWHISLSTWFKDYVYIPLGGNRVLKWRWYYNLFITFLVSGLWHGANWTFALWGALHGAYMVLDSFVAPWRDRFRASLASSSSRLAFDGLNLGLTLCLVLIAWIPFRANTFSEAWYIFTHLLSDVGSFVDPDMLALKFRGMGFKGDELAYCFVFSGIVIIYDLIDNRCGFWQLPALQQRPWLRWSVYYGVLFLVLFFSPYNRAQNFIYFQF
jgi:D-alanyl-lipoteichoic acid acyltransferase DltB (MBOAT superfamily)